MTTRTQRQAGRKHSFLPWLETLENRCCPAVTMSVLDGHILQVLGDRSDNVIEFDQRGSEIGVTFGGSSMRTFTGIDTVRVNTWAGRDTVRLVLETPPPAPEFSFTADLGAGDNLFSLAIPGNATKPPPSVVPPRVKVDVQGGAGNDVFQTFVGQLDVPLSAPLPHLGFGLDLDCKGGPGDDIFSTHFANVDVELPAVQRIDGGDGNDIIENTYTGDVLDAPLSLLVLGGNGNDKVSIQAERTNFDGAQTLTATVDGGAGNDFINVAIVDDVGDLYGADRAHVNLSIGGGNGNDQIRVQAGQLNDAPDPELRLDWNIAVTGDDGNDTIDVVARNLLLAGGMEVSTPPAFQLRVDGGNGNDTVNVQAEHTKFDGAQTLTATVDGGAGNDFINVAIVDPVGDLYGDDRAHANLSIDGGDGHDQIGVQAGQLHDAPDSELRLDWNIAAAGDAGDDTLTADLLPAVQRDGSFMASFDGGEGRDRLTAILLPAVQSGGSFKALFDGGDGRDTLTGTLLPAVQRGGAIDVAFLGGDGNDFIFMQVDMTGFTPESGRLRVAVDGGDGSDYMIFLVRGAEGPEESFQFTLDGGAGEDFAVASALVHAMNCEHVETL